MKDSFTERSKKLSEELERCLLADKNILVILDIMDRLNLSDCWLCAGTIRNFIWNQYSFDEETDVDLVFFDENISYEETMEIESNLYQNYPAYQWELKIKCICISIVRILNRINHQGMRLKNFQKDAQR